MKKFQNLSRVFLLAGAILATLIPQAGVAKTATPNTGLPPLFQIGPQGADSLLADPSVLSRLKSVNDYANIYYRNCVRINPDKEMDEYVQTQCACAAAAMPDALTLDQARTMFDPRNTDTYPYTRFMTLAYEPCLRDTVRNAVFDTCVDGQAKLNKLRSPRKVCGCLADGMRGYIKTFGYVYIPGNKGDHYDPSLAGDNPVAAVMNNPVFDRKSQYFEKTCLMREEYGW